MLKVFTALAGVFGAWYVGSLVASIWTRIEQALPAVTP